MQGFWGGSLDPNLAGWMGMGQSYCPHASGTVQLSRIHLVRLCLANALCWPWTSKLLQGRFYYSSCENI